MRFVPSLPPATASPVARDLKVTAAAKAVKPVAPGEGGVPYVAQRMARQTVPPVARQDQRTNPSDRRKECRRIGRQPFFAELRSGIERRRRALREGDMVDHIDEEA